MNGVWGMCMHAEKYNRIEKYVSDKQEKLRIFCCIMFDCVWGIYMHAER